MELPFAVETSHSPLGRKAPEQSNHQIVRVEDDSGSLVTASSQGSFLQSSQEATGSFEPALAAATPVVASAHTTAGVHHHQQQQQQHSHTHTQHPILFDNSHILREVPPSQNTTATPGGYVFPETNPSPAATTSNHTLTAALGNRVASVFSNLTAPILTTSTTTTKNASKSSVSSQPVETIDFTYVVWEADDDDEVDVVLPQGAAEELTDDGARGDILTLLLNRTNDDTLISGLEQANHFVTRAAQAKLAGELQQALDHHTAAAKLFYKAAVASKEHRAAVSESLLLLSQIQAKSAVALKRVVKLRPKSLSSLLQQTTGTSDRLRAKVRGALDNRAEADLSESTFLGRAGGSLSTQEEGKHDISVKRAAPNPVLDPTSALPTAPNHNPVDEMMALERELRDMDMTLELGSSIASLDARNQNRVKNMDGSFMVVAPGSQSYMSSSAMWSTPPQAVTNAHPPRNATSTGTAGARARANRIQASASRPHPAPSQKPQSGLESSWWDTSATSQVLTSSVASLASSVAHHDGLMGGHAQSQQQHPANTKQLMRLMDSLKTLGDENASLLRQVEEVGAARAEAKMAHEAMKRFKEDYNHKFQALREALKKFREEYPGDASSSSSPANPVLTSEYARTTSASDQLQRQEQLIRKLTTDLKKEKQESKKKDAALRKYENFYREVKARSAQKAAQRQKDASAAASRSRNKVG